MKILALALGLLAALPPLTVAQAADDSAAIVSRFMSAWDAADAKALASLFAPDADFVSPDGIAAQGRAHIEAFYAAAFARGFGGSKGEGVVLRQRALGPGLMLIDARFTIAGARHEDGSPRPAEKGILVAVLSRQNGDWRILALRENEGAGDLTAFPPAG